MKYALGPVLYYWPLDHLVDFYQLASESEADIIYLGETVCSKRRAISYQDWFDLAKQITLSGKQVIFSTLTLLTSSAELAELKRYVDNGEFMIEANDLAAVNMAATLKIPFVAGASLNCYNAYNLRLLLHKGMSRWCMPVELSKAWLEQLLQQCEELAIRHQFEVEIFGYGHLPLAYSARCFTARSENRSKDQCQTCCINYPTGRQVRSQEQQSLFVLNGIQTQSGYCYNLGNHIVEMHDLVDIIRLSPNDNETLMILSQFKQNEQGKSPMVIHNEKHCNGYWLNVAGLQLI